MYTNQGSSTIYGTFSIRSRNGEVFCWLSRCYCPGPVSTPPSALARGPKARGPSLYLPVLLAITLAVLLGWLRPAWGVAMQPLGDGFVRLIKMLIAPVVFTTLVLGIAGMTDLRTVGRTG